MRKTIAGTAALASAALAFTIAGSATAATLGANDPKDTNHGSDLRHVQIKNTKKNVVVTTTHTNLRPSPASGSGGAVYIDTDPAEKGPEYVFVGGYFQGTDYNLLHTDGFGNKKWGEPVEGSYQLNIDYAKDQVRMRMSRKALGNPSEVRVAVRVSGPSASSVDWLGKPHSFTEWVAKG